ncbi:TPA: hypothetical protein PXN84_004096 [Yersinia enterocolitica]|nr:hypothetical protein [Yersinia enterocolitica]HDL7434165.1 hypothetical protein [Yersinia enterocolitica]HDL7476574.1 hypothetical protein [Yersinia enterocolitica]HEN3248026.1 hypothetical protein [Yersinia enterocolitica]
MPRVSYPISCLELYNVVNSLKVSNTPIEKRQFYIDGSRFYDVEKVEKRVLEELVNRGWLEKGDEKENKRRVTVLEKVSQYSMATVALQHSQTMHPYLHYEGISMEFNLDSHYGLEMRYSVPYSDGDKRLFTLECQILLGKDFLFNEVESRVYYNFEKQCPSKLRYDVNLNSILEMIFDWFKELFTPKAYAAANTMSPPKNEYKGWVPPFVNLTKEQHDNQILDQENIFEGWVPPFVNLTKEQYDNDILDQENISERWVPPFVSLTKQQYYTDILEANLEVNFKIENEYYEDDPHENVGISTDNIHQEGYKGGYKDGSAEGYNEGVDIGFTIGEAKGHIKNLATER